MIESRYALCAVRAIRDAGENRMTVVDIVEELGSPGFPLMIPRMSFIWNLVRDEGDPAIYQGTVLLTQGAEELGRFPLDIDFETANATRWIGVVGGLVIPAAGRITVKFEIPDVVEATYFISAKAIPQLLAQAADPAVPPPNPGGPAGAIVI